MALDKFLAIALFAILVLSFVATATEYVVGGDSGWTNSVDYAKWAQDKVFHVGDTLVFKYTAPNHNVLKVNGTGFKDCIKPPPSEALKTGNDKVTLATPGKKWYICGVSTHCADNNQKLVINVVDPWAPAPAPSSPDTSTAAGSLSSGYQMLVAAVGALAMVVAVVV
ncbi:hypothetical protein ACFE04_028205 [Oxalis oulophora]